jgi:hypothetical protein
VGWSATTATSSFGSAGGAEGSEVLTGFVSFFATVVLFVVEVRKAGAFAVLVFVMDALGAITFAADDFVVADLADVDAFVTELFGGAILAVVAFFGFSGSSSVFFGRPRRTGALEMLALNGDSGGVPFACARWALVRTILIIRK